MYRKSLVSLMIAAAALTACGDDDPSGPEPVAGEFELTTQGAVAETAEGSAWFGSDVNDDGEPVFVLALGDESSRHFVMVGKGGATRPAVGTYDIESVATSTDGWTGLHMITAGDELLGMFFAETGTLTITESSSRVIRGSLEFDGTGVFGEDEAELQVTATFVAAPATALQ